MQEDWQRIIAQGETARVDFKGPMEWDGVARAALAVDVVAMANIRDGGTLLIGVDEREDGSGGVAGLTAQQAASFDPTKVVDYMSGYFKPPVNLQIERAAVEGKPIVVIRVAEFATSPIICIKDGPEKPSSSGKVTRYFYAGNLIVRTAAAKSEVIKTAEDMHALIRVAVTKTSNQLLVDFRRVLEGGSAAPEVLPHHRERAEWAKSLEEHRAKWAAKKPGYGTFSVQLLPSPIGKILDHETLRKMVQDSQVQLQGGWKIPSQFHAERFSTLQNRTSAVEGTLDLAEYQEVWQIHGSGAFMFARLLHYVSPDNEPRIAFEDVIAAVAGATLFAQRLFQELIPDGQVDLEFSLLGTKGQQLGSFDSFRLHFTGGYTSGEDVIDSRMTASVLELRSDWRAVVDRVVKELFVLFNLALGSTAINQRLDDMEGKRHR